jgi:hypothetical protein
MSVQRCQLQYLERGRWIDCAKPAKVPTIVGGAPHDVCPQHREDVRRIERAGLVASLRWSEHPSRPRRRPKQSSDQLPLVDVPATGRRGRRSR